MTTKTRKRLVLVLAILVFVGGYLGSFFAIRKTIVSHILATMSSPASADPAPPPERITLRLHYFSLDPTVHRTFYYAYYPIHSFLGGDVSLLTDGGSALRANRALADANGDFYVVSPADLNSLSDAKSPAMFP
jgi:hypothetical protein